MINKKLEKLLDSKNAKNYRFEKHHFILNIINRCHAQGQLTNRKDQKSAAVFRSELNQALPKEHDMRNNTLDELLGIVRHKIDVNDLWLIMLRCLGLIFPLFLLIFFCIVLITDEFSFGFKSMLACIFLLLLIHFNIVYTQSQHWNRFVLKHLEMIKKSRKL